MSLNRHEIIQRPAHISRWRACVFWSACFFFCLGSQEGGKQAYVKDNVRATMAENKILNVGRTSLEIEARALSPTRLPSRDRGDM